MGSSLWAFLRNPFESVTKGNNLKMLAIATYTDTALFGQIANPVILAIYNVYHPIFLAYEQAYGEWFSSDESSIGITSALMGLKKQLQSTLIRQWDVDIQRHYDLKSSRYKELMPHRRKSFQKGSYQGRYSALTSLIEAIGNDAILATLKGQILAFKIDYETAMINSGVNLTNTGHFSAALEIARKAMAIALMQVYFDLGKALVGNLKRIGVYFDLHNIMNRKQTTFQVTVPPGGFKLLFVHTLKPGDKVEIKNTGKAALGFGLMQTRNKMLPNPLLITANAKAITTITGSQIINQNFRYFVVVNTSEVEGVCTVKRMW